MKRYLLFLLVLGFFCHGCATAPPTGVLPREYLLKDLCRDYDVQWSWDSVNQIVTLNRGAHKARALIGSDVVVLDEENIALSRALEARDGTVFVPADFKTKIIDRLAKGAGTALKKFNRIVIDAGHGGKDPGAIGKTGLKEKVVVLDIAKRLRSALQDYGIRVTMTRDSDEFLSLEERAKLANRSNPDLFVSIHANASTNRGTDGLEIYCLRDLDRSAKEEIYRAGIYKVLFDKLAMDKNNPTLDKMLLDMLYTRKQGESRDLARFLSQNMADGLHLNNRGCKSAEFFVLKNTLVPAILVEVGFLTNRKEEKMLASGSYRRAFAEKLAKCIIDYANKY